MLNIASFSFIVFLSLSLHSISAVEPDYYAERFLAKFTNMLETLEEREQRRKAAQQAESDSKQQQSPQQQQQHEDQV